MLPYEIRMPASAEHAQTAIRTVEIEVISSRKVTAVQP